MSTAHEPADPAAPAPPTLEGSLRAFVAALEPAERADTLHGLFYGFYSRVAIVDRTTDELARWAREEIPAVAELPAPLADALRDNALHVGRELFAARIGAMTAMGYVARQLAELRPGLPAESAWTLTRAVAYDGEAGELRSYDLGRPGEHPDLPYDPFGYDPSALGG
jgi:hypothetical protein